MFACGAQARLLQEMTRRRYPDVARQQQRFELLVQRLVDLGVPAEQRGQLAAELVACGGKSSFQPREPAPRSSAGVCLRCGCLVGSAETQHTEGCQRSVCGWAAPRVQPEEN